MQEGQAIDIAKVEGNRKREKKGIDLDEVWYANEPQEDTKRKDLFDLSINGADTCIERKTLASQFLKSACLGGADHY